MSETKRPMVKAVRITDQPDEPQVAIEDLENHPYGVQFFPRRKRNEMSVGFTLTTFQDTHADVLRFKDAVEHHTEFYATTSNTKPKFHSGRVYLHNYFGVLFGPLDADPDDRDAVIAEAAEALKPTDGKIVDNRKS
jgi:hypothetical protein